MLAQDLSQLKADRENSERSQPRNRLWIWLIIFVIVSFGLRLAAWAHYQPGSIESEGAEYARIAQNLRNGVGYVGLVTPGVQLNFNPLFPLLIAGTSFLTRNYELAARVVALAMGTLLPLPVFGVASKVFDRRVGYVAAALTLLHPLLVNLSFSAFSEGPYTTLFVCATYITILALDDVSPRMWVLVGGMFGLAWLVRAEATVALAISVLFALMATEGNWRVRCRRAMYAIVMFLVCALPVVIFIYRSTGELRLEVKSQIFFYTGARILAAEKHPGIEYVSPGREHEIPSPEPNVDSWQRWQDKWAFYGIATSGKGMGFPLRQHVEIVKETNMPVKDELLLVAKGTRQNAPVLLQRLASDWIGAPLLPALALLGALRRPWQGKRAKAQWFLLFVGAAPVAATFFALWSETRYYFVLVPLMLVWAANGLVEMGLWAEASVVSPLRQRGSMRRLAQYAIPSFFGIVMIVSPFKAVRRLPLFEDSAASTRPDKELGAWIARQQPYPVKIVDLSIPLAFHADAQFTYFPYCDTDEALRYLDHAKVDYVILRRDEKFTKYYEDWLEHGLPETRSTAVDVSFIDGGGKYRVYRWHWKTSSSEPAEASDRPSHG